MEKAPCSHAATFTYQQESTVEGYARAGSEHRESCERSIKGFRDETLGKTLRNNPGRFSVSWSQLAS
jgi:hypothetical protein